MDEIRFDILFANYKYKKKAIKKELGWEIKQTIS
jgi:hypothetical protein